MANLLSRIRNGNFIAELMAEGRVFHVSDADQDDVVGSQASFANTTPTFLLDVPSGTTALPLMLSLVQSGTVAGGTIFMSIEIDNADRYGSGGTAETHLAGRTDAPITKKCTLYTGATANAGYGVRIFGAQVGQDLATAEGAVNEILWTPTFGAPPILVGPAAFACYTWASTPGPQWNWAFQYAELPTSDAI